MIFNTKEERERVIIENMDLVHSIALRYAKQTGIHVEELESCGYEGLIIGIDKYNPANKSGFRTSLNTPIKRAIEKHINFINNYHKFVPDSLVQHKEDIIEQESILTKSIEHEVLKEELHSLIKDTLNKKEQIVLSDYYGLNNQEPKNFEIIGLKNGYSGQNAQQILKRALLKIRYQIARKPEFFREANHDIDAEVGYAKRKKRK